MEVLLFLLLPVAAFSGWIIGQRGSSGKATRRYFSWLNYSISRQPDQTVETLIKMSTIDDDTIETHLTLGSIFRRRGELERALRLHQSLLERPTLSIHYKSQAMLELARDYLAAGVLDRAETILLELISNKDQLAPSLQHLLDLYQQGKEWLAAINIAYKLQDVTANDLRPQIAHFYCELAEQALKTQQYKQAIYCLKRALRTKHDCPRAIILRANIEQALGNYNKAIKLYKHVATKNMDYFPAVINEIIKCYQSSSDNAYTYQEQARDGTKFRCNNCGFLASKLQWHCPGCKQWDMIKPVQNNI